MSLSDWEYSISLVRLSWESNSFHATNSFASEVDALSRLSTRVENVSDDMIANMFLEAMSDHVSNVEQSSEIMQGSQPNSLRASSDSANSVDGTATNLGNVWPPLDALVIALGDWPNSNREQATSSNIK